MGRPPRPVGAPLFSRRDLAIAGLQGASVLVTTLAVYVWAILVGEPDDVVRSTDFLALVTGNLSLILVNRSWRLSIRQMFKQRANRTLKWILPSASAMVVLLLLTVPALRDAFNFGPLHLFDWIVALSAGLVSIAWFEIYKRHAHR